MMEVYTNDMVVKSVNAENHTRDLKEVFNILRQFNMMLNKSRCNFAVSSGKFLGHMVARKEIEASLEQASPHGDKTCMSTSLSQTMLSALFSPI